MRGVSAASMYPLHSAPGRPLGYAANLLYMLRHASDRSCRGAAAERRDGCLLKRNCAAFSQSLRVPRAQNAGTTANISIRALGLPHLATTGVRGLSVWSNRRRNLRLTCDSFLVRPKGQKDTMGHQGGHAVEGVPARPREELNNLAKNVADCAGEPEADLSFRPSRKIPILCSTDNQM